MPLDAANSCSYIGASAEHPPTPEPIFDYMVREYRRLAEEDFDRRRNGLQLNLGRHWLLLPPLGFRQPGWGRLPLDTDEERGLPVPRCNPELSLWYRSPSPGLEETPFDQLLRDQHPSGAPMGWGQPNADRFLYTQSDELAYRNPYRRIHLVPPSNPEEEHRPLPQIFEGSDEESDSSEDSAELLVTDETISRGMRVIEEQQRTIDRLRETNRLTRAVLDRLNELPE